MGGIVKIVLAVLLLILSGCTRYTPARLKLADVHPDARFFEIRFSSDTRFENLYVDSFFQSPGSAAFICSNEQHPRFDVEYETNNIARGVIKYEGTDTTHNKNDYIYRAHLIFWTTDKESPHEMMLSADEVILKLKNQQHLACRVRVSVYMGSPYYSEILYIPTDLLTKMAKNISTQTQPAKHLQKDR